MRYELYYWPDIQGRGEFIRLALEQAGANYLDVARLPAQDGMGMPAMMDLLQNSAVPAPPFAPPFLKAGKLLIAQTANILFFLGPRLNLVPEDDASRLWANQLQLTIADLVTEVHDTHHPIAGSLYYKDQKAEAMRRARFFIAERIPKFLNYFEHLPVPKAKDAPYLIGDALSYVDLSMFQIIAGLRYAFPQAMRHQEPEYPRLLALHALVASDPRIATYLVSPRRLPFNKKGIFRHYAELDA
ncbi:MAG: glutathione S-transferase family protein [Undibacterium sp.]|uniref:glutathione S-transferase n=1 Tax=Undibacterium sp. TaxID=1914977 RepID=UPI0027173640|nr:glutathione S-transferase [Undibacterium sp.]MDO8651905.1 glutathione S-transferase family protein [Undibacterium sp.]